MRAKPGPPIITLLRPHTALPRGGSRLASAVGSGTSGIHCVGSDIFGYIFRVLRCHVWTSQSVSILLELVSPLKQQLTTAMTAMMLCKQTLDIRVQARVLICYIIIQSYSKILFVVALNFYIYIQINYYKSRHT